MKHILTWTTILQPLGKFFQSHQQIPLQWQLHHQEDRRVALTQCLAMLPLYGTQACLLPKKVQSSLKNCNVHLLYIYSVTKIYLHQLNSANHANFLLVISYKISVTKPGFVKRNICICLTIGQQVNYFYVWCHKSSRRPNIITGCDSNKKHKLGHDRHLSYRVWFWIISLARFAAAMPLFVL